MYFWNTKSLAEKLAFGKIETKEKPKYVLYILALLGVTALAVIKSFLVINLISALLCLLLLASGYFVAAKKNQSRDGKDFGIRAISLTGPLFLKILVGLFLLFGIAKWFFPEFSHTNLFLIPTWSVFTGIYLKWFLAQIEEVSRPKVSWEAHQGI